MKGKNYIKSSSIMEFLHITQLVTNQKPRMMKTKIEKYKKRQRKHTLVLPYTTFSSLKALSYCNKLPPLNSLLLSIASPYFSSVYQYNCTYIQNNQKCKKISKFINPPIKQKMKIKTKYHYVF